MEAEELQARIEVVRKAMIDVGMSRGLSDPETIKVSQELDELLNELDRQKREG